MKEFIRPQVGFQTDFLSSPADIVIGGGSAGGGKTFAELLEASRNTKYKDFNCMFFRRTSTQIKTPGGLWDNSLSMYNRLGAKPNSTELSWTFYKPGTKQPLSRIKFSHLEYEQNIYDHQGGQYCLIIFDEVTHFTKKMFTYLLSRNRSACGVKPYVRATCNPDPDSWVAGFLEWWIDQDTGFPIPERSGRIRYMLVHNDDFVWGDSKGEVISKMPPDYWNNFPDDVNPHDLVKSVTFIPGSIYENKELLSKDPGYLANLMAQDEEEKSRLLFGNWKIRTDGTSLFHFDAINSLFSNYPTETGKRYITCDAARHGRDFTVIFVWKGWLVVRIIVLMSTSEEDIVSEIEEQRKEFNVMKSNVLIDQDGVGGGAVGAGGYKGFQNGGKPLRDPETDLIENYENRKTQCYYRIARKVNIGLVGVVANNETVVIVERSGRRYHGLIIKVSGREMSVVELLKNDLRAIKKRDADLDGKRRINPKEDQKIILNGRSPDFGDSFMMREQFDLQEDDNWTIGVENY